MRKINKQFFQDPTTDPDHSTSGFWFWNDRISDDGIEEQLNMMHRIHADCPVVHARMGLETEYLSRDWFDRIRTVLNVCRKNGQRIWLYDEDNWPSGNCNWTLTEDERNREHFLSFTRKPVKKGEAFPEEAGEVLCRRFLCDGELSAAEGTALADGEYFCVRVEVDPYEGWGKYSIDYLSRRAIRLFLDSTHEKYAAEVGDEFGRLICGIFMDEPRFANALPWTETFAEEFLSRKGYDVVPLLPLLVCKGKGSDELRWDYYDVVSDLYTESTFGQIRDWCDAHGILLTGHFLGEETIAAQSYFGADMLRGYKYFHVPGIDHLGNGMGSLDGKFASGAAHCYGKERISCEAFGASGWDIGYEDMVRISNWLFQQGINLIWMHGFYYSIRGQRIHDFPPSYFYQWKDWDRMPEYIPMSNRMSEMLSGGRHEAETLVYVPIESYWCDVEHDLTVKTGFGTDGPQIRGRRAAQIDSEFQQLCNRLSDENLDYDLFPADAAENFFVRGGKLCNRLSGEEYSVLVLPFVRVLPAAVAALVREFSQNGGTLLLFDCSQTVKILEKGGNFYGRAETACLCGTEVGNVTEAAEAVKKASERPFRILRGVDKMSRLLSAYPSKVIDPYIHTGERVSGVGVTRYLKEDGRIFNFTNYNMREEPMHVWIRGNERPVLYDVCTGEIRPMTEAEKTDGGYAVRFTIPANRAVFIVGERDSV